MNIEKKGIICGAIWGIISIKLAELGYNGILKYIYLPANIVSLLGELIFGDYRRELFIFMYLFYIIGSIFAGAFFGYIVSKIIMYRYKKEVENEN